MSSFERFESSSNRQHAIEASVPAWHVHEWIWHERHPGIETGHNSKFQEFQRTVLDECPQLAWIRDVADASKHRGLGRLKGKPKEVHRMQKKLLLLKGPLGTYGFNEMPLNSPFFRMTLNIVLNDGTEHYFGDVLSKAINYWRANYFAPAE